MKMKLRYVVTLLIMGLLILSTNTVFCEDTVSMSEWKQIIEKIGTNGNINWSAGYIEAVGIGAPPERFIGKIQARPMALRAAELVAKRNLLEITKGVRIDSTTLVKDFVVESDVINSQVEGIVKGATVVKQDYMSDGSVEVTVRMPLLGDFSSAIMPKVLDKKPIARPQPPAPPVQTAPEGRSYTSEPRKPSSGAVYTGMVVDARGMQTRPAMSPKILDESGQEVYGSVIVEREFAVQQGMSGYARDLTSAQGNQRVTNNPITVKAIRAQGAGKSDIIISNADAAALRSAADNLSFMKKCRVMIVLD
jgi:hypothetical protein